MRNEKNSKPEVENLCQSHTPFFNFKKEKMDQDNILINEDQIDKTIDRFDGREEEYEDALSTMMDKHPSLVAFMTQESSQILTEEEKDLAWYIILILMETIAESGFELEHMDHQKLLEYEEANWDLLNQQRKGSFRDRISIFFVDTSQEDMLAFVEDTLEEDEMSPVTPVGREVIFVMTKTIIDVIADSLSNLYD